MSRPTLWYFPEHLQYCCHRWLLTFQKGSLDAGQTTHGTTIPVTVLSLNRRQHETYDIAQLIKTFLTEDDVWSTDFLSTVVIQLLPDSPAKNIVSLDDDKTFIQGFTSRILFTTVQSRKMLLPSGPYFVHESQIHEAWRLYADELDCFEITVVPDESNLSGKWVHIEPTKMRLER